jgi:hypothetical protein
MLKNSAVSFSFIGYEMFINFSFLKKDKNKTPDYSPLKTNLKIQARVYVDRGSENYKNTIGSIRLPQSTIGSFISRLFTSSPL